jgi:hypothetical protein
VRLNEPLDEAYIYLGVSGAHGVPVVSDRSDSVDELKHFGYSDLVEWVVGTVGNLEPNVHSTWSRREFFLGKTVNDCLGSHPTEPVAIAQHTASLLDVCKVLVEKHAHRVFVLEEAVLVNVISPSMIAEFLLKNKDRIDEHQLHQTMKQLGLTHHRAIFSVNESASLFEAFKYLVGEKVTGCAVMKGDKIVGTIR